MPDYEIKLDISNEHVDESTDRIILKKQLNSKAFKLKLYQFLYPKYIDCEYEDFNSLFGNSINKISWKGSLVDLALIFKGTKSNSFTDPNYVVLEALTKCFSINGKELNYHSLKSMHSRCLKESVKTKYDKILTFLKNY